MRCKLWRCVINYTSLSYHYCSTAMTKKWGEKNSWADACGACELWTVEELQKLPRCIRSTSTWLTHWWVWLDWPCKLQSHRHTPHHISIPCFRYKACVQAQTHQIQVTCPSHIFFIFKVMVWTLMLLFILKTGQFECVTGNEWVREWGGIGKGLPA